MIWTNHSTGSHETRRSVCSNLDSQNTSEENMVKYLLYKRRHNVKVYSREQWNIFCPKSVTYWVTSVGDCVPLVWLTEWHQRDCVPKAWLTEWHQWDCVPKAWLTEWHVPKAWLTEWLSVGGTYGHTEWPWGVRAWVACATNKIKIS